jgi:hypothetical protein
MSTPNHIIQQMNALMGSSIPTASYLYAPSAASVPVGATVYLVSPSPISGSIPTTGIYPGGIIKSEQILNIINALNGVSAYNIAIAGSASLQTSLDMPFVLNEDLLVSNTGSIIGTDKVDGGSF